jgi:hypothetical protein
LIYNKKYKNNRNILITGCRRSGTTFLGRMLSVNKSISYIHEPFNYYQGLKEAGIKGWYPYITKENINNYNKEEIDKLFRLGNISSKVSLNVFNSTELKYNVKFTELLKNIYANYSNEGLSKRITRIFIKNRFYQTYLLSRLNFFKERILIKDPLAALSSNYLAEEYNLDVIVIIRHPAAYFTSMKKLRWGVDSSNFLKQQLLMKDYLNSFKSQLESSKKLIERAVMEYLCVNTVLENYRKKNKRFMLVRFEDLCLNPIQQIKKIYEQLSLDYSEKVEQVIINYTSDKNIIFSENVSDIKRNSKRLVNSWKDILSDEEVGFIRDKTYPFAKKYYDESTWEKDT